MLTKTLRDVTSEAKNMRRDPKERTRLKSDTIQLLKERRDGISKGEDVRFLSRKLRKKVEADYKDYNEQKAIEAAEKKQSIKNAKKATALHKEATFSMKDQLGTVQWSKSEIAKIVSDFYTSLFDSKLNIANLDGYCHEEIPTVLPVEIRAALKKMNVGKAMGQDKIAIDILKEAPGNVFDIIAYHFDIILRYRKVPPPWKKSSTLLQFKKGDKDNIENYRPICLMSQMTKLFSRVILNRISSKLNEGSRSEQAGFKKGFSTIDNIHAVTQLIERANEYQIPLNILFVDFRKAFDSVEITAVLNALRVHAIPEAYVTLIGEMYKNCETDISLGDISVTVPVERGVKQGDVLSPILFSAALESALRTAEMPHGIQVNGVFLKYLLFADDVVMFAHSSKDLDEMVNSLNESTSKLGLEIHSTKSQWMSNHFNQPDQHQDIMINGKILKKIEEYTYLGRSVNMTNSMKTELNRRKQAGWHAFSKLRDILTSKKISANTKAHVFNTHVTPAMTYACETWSLTGKEEHFLQVTQRKMERRMTNIRLISHTTNEELRRRSKVEDILDTVYLSKRRWAGHVIRREDNRWAKILTEWRPWDHKRPRGRPPTRWSDPMVKCYGQTWTRLAKRRDEWRRCDLRRWRAND